MLATMAALLRAEPGPRLLVSDARSYKTNEAFLRRLLDVRDGGPDWPLTDLAALERRTKPGLGRDYVRHAIDIGEKLLRGSESASPGSQAHS